MLTRIAMTAIAAMLLAACGMVLPQGNPTPQPENAAASAEQTEPASTEQVEATPMASHKLPDGTTVEGVTYSQGGFLNSSRTIALFRCGFNKDKKKECIPLEARASVNPGWIQIPTTAVHGLLGSALLAATGPEQAAGAMIVNAPFVAASAMAGSPK